MHTFIIFAAVTLGATGTASADSHAKVVTTSELKVGAHATVVVDNAAGGVMLQAGPAGVVKVEAEREADSEGEARKLDVQIGLEGNTVRAKFNRAPDGHRGDQPSVSFRISAPVDTKIEVRTRGGAVEARGFHGGGIRLDTDGGGISVADLGGAVQLRSGGGSIDAKRVNGSFEVTTGGGSIRVEGTLSGRNRIETGGGSIKVAIPAASRLSVDAATGGGSAHNDFGLPNDGERHSGRFHGTLGDGKDGSLALRTGGGAIHLDKGD